MISGSIGNFDVEERQRNLLGYKDGGHNILTCSACNAALMDVWVTGPNVKLAWKVRATCPYCPPKDGGTPTMSFVTEVRGAICPGGIAAKEGRVFFPTKDSDEVGRPHTRVGDVKYDNGVSIFRIDKEPGNDDRCYL